jgi:integrase-like protein
MWKDITEYVRTCDICQRYGPREHSNPLQPYRPVCPFEYIFMDYIVNLPLTSKRNRHLLVMTEGLTKWIEAKPTKETTALTSMKFLEGIICRYGAPIVVITDNGTHFKGEFDQLCKGMGIQHRLGTPYHPQTTGQVERTNGLLLGRIRKWRLEEYKKWDEDVEMSVLACNTRKTSATSFSPMEALMGYTASTASTLRMSHTPKKELKEKLALVAEDTSAEDTTTRLHILETLRDEIQRVRTEKTERMKERYDKKTHNRDFNEGQEVLLYDMSLLKQWSRKLEERWTGPYVVIWKGDLGAYVIDMGNHKTKTVSGDHLKAYHRRL